MHNKYCNAKLIKKKLDNFVMGQEQGTRAIAMAFAQHFLRIEASEYYSGRKITKDNVLFTVDDVYQRRITSIRIKKA